MNKIIAVMPCYRSSKIAPKIAKDVLGFVDRLVCVDDDCPENTGKSIESSLKSDLLDLIYHDRNKGIGGAMKTGIKYAIEKKFDAIWLMDDDGYPDRYSLEILKKSINREMSCLSSIVVKENNPEEFVFPYPILNENNQPMDKWLEFNIDTLNIES